MTPHGENLSFGLRLRQPVTCRSKGWNSLRTVSRRFLSPALFLAGMFAGSAFALPALAQRHPQTNMTAALAALNSAYGYLQAADPDKGGYRIKAMSDVQDAIANVKAGIRYASRH